MKRLPARHLDVIKAIPLQALLDLSLSHTMARDLTREKLVAALAQSLELVVRHVQVAKYVDLARLVKP